MSSLVLVVSLLTFSMPQQPACAGNAATARAFVHGLEAATTLPELVVGSGPDCEQGWVALRRFELTGERALAEQALDRLLRASRRKESAAWAYYGLGRLILKAPWLNPGQELVFVDAKSRMLYAAREALARDPSLYEAGVLLGEVSILGQDRKEIRETRDLLRKYEGQLLSHVSPTIFELNTWLRDAQGMLNDVQRAAAGATNSALVDRARAVAYAELRDTLAGSAYEAAVAVGDSATLLLLFDDLRAIVGTEDTVAFMRGDLETKRAWLRNFWNARAANSGQTSGDRVAEHYRRLLIARERYAYAFRTNKGAAPAVVLLQPIKALKYLDDRAMIYLRHGEPTSVQPGSGTYYRPNETWYYRPPRDGINAFIFTPFDGASGYRLVDDPFSVFDLSAHNIRLESSVDFAQLQLAQIGLLSRALVLDDLAEWFKAHLEVDPRYGMIANRLSSLAALGRMRTVDPQDIKAAQEGVHSASMSIAAERRGALLAAAMGESNIPKFERDLTIGYDIYGFRGSSGTDVTVAVGMRASEVLDPVANALRFRAAVQWRAQAIIRADTAFNIPLPRALPPGASIATTLRRTLPAGERPYFLTVFTTDEKAGRQVGGTHRVRDFSGSGLLVSDLVIADAGRQGTWRRGSARLALVPHATFPVDAPFAVFYEIYNLPQGEEFTTELYLVRDDEPLRNRVRGRKTDLTLKFTSTSVLDSETGAMQELRNVQTAFEPGRYKLRVTVTRKTGESASAERTVSILDRAN